MNETFSAAEQRDITAAIEHAKVVYEQNTGKKPDSIVMARKLFNGMGFIRELDCNRISDLRVFVGQPLKGDWQVYRSRPCGLGEMVSHGFE